MLFDNNFRGLGIGKLLIDKFKQYCKDNSINNLKVVASAKNIKAIEFYKNNGFNDFDITLTTEIH